MVVVVGKEATKGGGPGLLVPLEDCELQRCAELVFQEDGEHLMQG